MATEKEKLKAVRSMQKIRETRIKAGGKSIGTTIDADSACALELLCNRYNMQQREVIQLALQHLLLLKLPLRAVREAIGEPYNG